MILGEGGRRSGKTTGSLAPKAIIALIIFAGLPGEVLSPTYRQSMNVWIALLKLTPTAWWISKHKTDRILTLVNGSSVKLLSADRDDSARSEGVAWGAYDERQDIGEAAAANAFLSTSEGGKHFLIFETATIKPELREHHDRVMASDKGIVYSMSSYGNPFIAHDFLDDASEFLDETTIDREIRGKWPELQRRVYPRFRVVDHVRSYPIRFKQDATAAWLFERFDYRADTGDPFFISIDPPRHAVLWKIYEDGTLHAVDEVVIGADGTEGIDGDVKDLARACAARCGSGRGVVIFDPHESRFDKDCKKYFRGLLFRVAFVKRMRQEYKLTAVRSRIEKSKLFVDPRCRFYAETLEKHQRDEKTNQPDKRTMHQGTKIQLVHIGDAGAYGIYKLFPAKVDYEKKEKDQAA